MEHDTHRAPVLFIADLHLDPARPAITELFLAFLAGEARHADALYILGDLFEAWIGDDAVASDDPIIAGLRALSDSGVPVYIMHGNRDFLLGETFAAMSGAELLPEPCRIEIDGEPTLLMHGDSLCVDDVEYQRFRAMVRDPDWQAKFLAKPLAERQAFAEQARTESAHQMSQLDNTITDVNDEAVERSMADHGVLQLIHGHTHRPAVHELTLAGQTAQRIVLGDWFEQGSVLRARSGGLHLEALPLDE
jgi:UDP-2,3-diacylglucosamine hydrolase